jgi:PAS domain S-box-containing protein
MAHASIVLSVLPEYQPVGSRISSEHCVRVQPEYGCVVNERRRFVHVSPSFCKLLGYSEEEMLGMTFDEFTVPRTNHIPILWQLLIDKGYLQGIWVFAHRGGTKFFVRFETFARSDNLYETRMDLLGAGA